MMSRKKKFWLEKRYWFVVSTAVVFVIVVVVALFLFFLVCFFWFVYFLFFSDQGKFIWTFTYYQIWKRLLKLLRISKGIEFCTFFSTAFLASTSHSLFMTSFQCIHCKKMCFSFILLCAVVFLSFPIYPANIYLFKLNNRNNRKSGNICSRFTVDLVSLLLNLNIFHTFYYFYS